MFNNFFSPENRVICKIMWKNIVQPEEPQMTVWRMHMAGWIPKVTNTHAEYVILIASLGFFNYLQMSGGTCVRP